MRFWRQVFTWRQIGRFFLGSAAAVFASLAYCWVTLPDVRPLRTSTPPTTAFMRLRASEAGAADRQVTPDRRLVRYNRISPLLVRAVLSAEDAGFFSHDGLDYHEIGEAIDISLDRGINLRGASTITQQLAKNLYLSPLRSPFRKVTEFFITRRLEAELSKTRILELYLNVIEWGDNIWGAEAAARRYFGITAAELSADQAALLAGALINPREHSPARPTRRLLRRQQIILGRMDRQTPPAERAPGG